MKHHMVLRLRLLSVPALVLMISSCGNSTNYTAIDPAPRWDTAMDIIEVTVALPDSNGATLVQTSCVSCHSLRYIEMQPRMSRKAWDKIVTKMIKNFGAPVKDSVTAAQITDYLVAVKGKA